MNSGFKMGELIIRGTIIDSSKQMYVYICDHPLQSTLAMCCVPVGSKTDTPTRGKVWAFLKKDSNYSVVGMHQNMDWVKLKYEVLHKVMKDQQVVESIASMQLEDPATKKQIKKELDKMSFGRKSA